MQVLQEQAYPVDALAEYVNLPIQETKFLVERLEERRFVELFYWRRRFPFYRLTRNGRQFLFGAKYT